jgi:hypothetical protein
MSSVNPYITTDKDELEILKKTFRLFVSSESKKRKDLSHITFIRQDKYKINDEVFDLEWNVIKSMAHEPSHFFLLEYFVKLRKVFVDSLVYIVIKKTNSCENNEVRFNKCTAVALGSSSITSDYDINLSSDNPMINSEIIKNFNILFFNYFGKNSSTVFDTNIYGIGFLNKKKYFIPIETRVQSVIAFVKLVYIEEKYGINTREEFSINNKRFSSLYLDAHDFYMSKIKGKGNDQYFDTLELIQEVLGDGNDLSIIENLSIIEQEKVQSLISLANMFANETYFTQGSFLHVVSRLQSDESIELSETDYINSMFENFFELNKEYAIFKYSLDVNLFLRSSYKYLYRFYDAAKEAGLSIDSDMYQMFKNLEIFRKGNKNNIENQYKIKRIQESLDILLGKDNSGKKSNGSLTNFDKITDLSLYKIEANSEIKEYMDCFWAIFMLLYEESILVLPSPISTPIGSIVSLKRRDTSFFPKKNKIYDTKRFSADDLTVYSKSKRLSDRKKSRNELKE